MQIFSEIDPIRAFLGQQRIQGKSIGFVPTMGALHQGHLELIRQSKANNEVTVCSIFVNPAQFNNPSDLAKYPKKTEEDIQLLQDAGCDVLFLPLPESMYPIGKPISFQLSGLDQIFEGEFRPGHFSGVALVVSKLFNITQPHRTYFGQKDFQQVLVVRKLIDDLNFPVSLQIVPTVRESDGLAMSSRNLRLGTEDRSHAIVLYESLLAARQFLMEGKKFEEVQRIIAEKCNSTPRVRLEYFALASIENLKPLKSVVAGTKAVLLIAAYVGEVRLIDNLLIHED